MRSIRYLLLPLFSSLIATSACSTSSSGTSSGDAGPAGGPVTGAQDVHCSADGGTSQAVSAASCHPGDAGAPADAGATDGGGGGVEYGATEFNAEGDDDDCKYHVKWTATPVRQGSDVTFTVTVTTKDGNAPMRPLPGEGTGGIYPVRAEVFLNDTHPAPNSTQSSAETSTQGTYTVGPIRFDASGQWTVRFHFHESCEDTLDDSPHGHAAFFVQVP
jgi:hypothetical protein